MLPVNKHASETKYIITQNKYKKLKPGLVASYNILYKPILKEVDSK